MKKRVKGGIEKHYCDKCGKNIFDYVPADPVVKLGGKWLNHYTVKKHCEYAQPIVNERYGEYCAECAPKGARVKK